MLNTQPVSHPVPPAKRPWDARLARRLVAPLIETRVTPNHLTTLRLGVGLAAAAALTRLMASLLFEISPVDPLTYIAVSGGLLSAAAAASYFPAHRASTVNPVEALRAE